MSYMYAKLIEFAVAFEKRKYEISMSDDVNMSLGYTGGKPMLKWYVNSDLKINGKDFYRYWVDNFSKKKKDDNHQLMTEESYLLISYNDSGASGGNCWGDSAHYYTHSEPSDFNFDPFIKGLHAEFFSGMPLYEFLHQLDLRTLITETSYSENEYYGNYSNYQCKLINLRTLAKAMESIREDVISVATLYDRFEMSASLDEVKGFFTVIPVKESGKVIVRTKLTKQQVKNALIKMIDDAEMNEG